MSRTTNQHHRRRNATTPLLATLAAAAALAAPAALAGPLTPPAGPIAPTHKTLSQVEPRTPLSAATTPGDDDSIFRITQPGSYYLTGNLEGFSGKSGIEIAASHVTIDLGGFALRGNGSGASGITMATSGFYSAVAVHSGAITGWSDVGIDLDGAPGGRISNVTITNCHIALESGNGAIVESCTARDNQNGIFLRNSATARACAVTGTQFTGIAAGWGSLIVDCDSSSNTGTGFALSGRSTARSCVAASNGNMGFDAGFSSTIDSCSAIYNGAGGIRASGSGVTITRCSVKQNSLFGIWTDGQAEISHNHVHANATSGTTVAGIYVAAGTSRVAVHHNVCTGNDYGIRIDGTHNAVFANACSLNDVNFQIAASNRVGPIAVGALSGAITGDSGGAGMGSTDPHANFAY